MPSSAPDLDVQTAANSHRRQARIASGLGDAGLRDGDRLVLMTGGSTRYVDTVLAASRIGVVPVPIDPRLTPRERAVIIDDVEPTLVIDSASALADLEVESARSLAAHPRCRPLHFTSGTTGRPKGVWSGLLSQEHAAALVAEERDLWGFAPTDRHLVASPVYHSAPLRFAMGTLLAGGSISVLPHFEPAAWIETVRAVGPTTSFCVPAHLQRLFAHIDATGEPLPTDSFRLLAHAGAPCPTPIRQRAHELFGTDVVWEFYGSTEGQFTACPAPEWLAHPGTLGRARPGRSVWVDDEDVLWCAVPPWARFTYWRDPERTAAAWCESRHGPSFTVGDLGRVENEQVYLDARRTDLIISGGVNVYPAEIESVLELVPGVDEIAVIGVPDLDWGQRVHAIWVGSAAEADLRAAAAADLAPPKRPKTYANSGPLPRTATGKILRTQLSAP